MQSLRDTELGDHLVAMLGLVFMMLIVCLLGLVGLSKPWDGGVVGQMLLTNAGGTAEMTKRMSDIDALTHWQSYTTSSRPAGLNGDHFGFAAPLVIISARSF